MTGNYPKILRLIIFRALRAHLHFRSTWNDDIIIVVYSHLGLGVARRAIGKRTDGITLQDTVRDFMVFFANIEGIGNTKGPSVS